MTILLRDIWPVQNLTDYKLHFARWNKRDQPLEVWHVTQGNGRAGRNTVPARDDFNRPFIFSLMQFYHEPDIWLFGGIFRVLARHQDRYEAELSDTGAGFIGRLKLRSTYRDRTTRVSFENHYPSFEVQEVLREPYSGRSFPGYDDIDLSFEELETLVRNSRPDWRAALESVRGIYLITDTKNGRRYVGPAYAALFSAARGSAVILPLAFGEAQADLQPFQRCETAPRS